MAYCFPEFLCHLNINPYICSFSRALFWGQSYLPCHLSWRLGLVPDTSWSLSPQSQVVTVSCQVSLLNICQIYSRPALHPLLPKLLPQPPVLPLWRHKADPILSLLRTIHDAPESSAASSGST